MKNKGIIFLNGGGSEKDSIQLDKEFLSVLEDNFNILYIPHANIKQYPNYESSINWLTQTLNNLDSNKKVNIYVPKSYEEFEKIDLDNYSAIYIGGGNTFFLLNLFKKYNFNKKIINYYTNGGIIYGGSAGAIVMGKTIETVPEERNDKTEISEGLNLINGYSLICHTNDKTMEKIKNNNIRPIICLYENTGIVFKNNKFTLFGKKYEEFK